MLLDVQNLVREYPLRKGGVFPRRVGTVYAVEWGVFDVRRGEALALVGESGCGKTSTVTEIMELRAAQGGTVTVLGKDTATMTDKERFAIRGDLQIVFQDPLSSLDPASRSARSSANRFSAPRGCRRCSPGPRRRTADTCWARERRTPTATRPSSPAASVSASRSPARLL